MKYKPKLKYKLMAVLMTAISLFCLSIPASALVNHHNTGLGAANWSDIDPPIGYAANTDSFAWRVDLYVSTNADGRINESSDTIGNRLALVGSVLCTRESFFSNYYTHYLQTNYTDRCRDQFNSNGYTVTKNFWTGDISGKTYTLPTLIPFSPLDGIYTDTSSNTVAVSKTGQKL